MIETNFPLFTPGWTGPLLVILFPTHIPLPLVHLNFVLAPFRLFGAKDIGRELGWYDVDSTRVISWQSCFIISFAMPETGRAVRGLCTFLAISHWRITAFLRLLRHSLGVMGYNGRRRERVKAKTTLLHWNQGNKRAQAA